MTDYHLKRNAGGHLMYNADGHLVHTCKEWSSILLSITYVSTELGLFEYSSRIGTVDTYTIASECYGSPAGLVACPAAGLSAGATTLRGLGPGSYITYDTADGTVGGEIDFWRSQANIWGCGYDVYCYSTTISPGILTFVTHVVGLCGKTTVKKCGPLTYTAPQMLYGWDSGCNPTTGDPLDKDMSVTIYLAN